jgi:hypothetical protein
MNNITNGEEEVETHSKVRLVCRRRSSQRRIETACVALRARIIDRRFSFPALLSNAPYALLSENTAVIQGCVPVALKQELTPIVISGIYRCTSVNLALSLCSVCVYVCVCDTM